MKPLTLEETRTKTDDNEMCIKGIDELPIFSWNTKNKEFYVLGHKFDGINSIEDFINYIHNLDKENKSLQSQLKAKEEEKQQLKKQLEEINKFKFSYRKDETKIPPIIRKQKDVEIIKKLENQQKEFIEYMNKTIEELECDDVDDEEMKGYLIQRIDTFKEILSKYKEIIGDSR